MKRFVDAVPTFCVLNLSTFNHAANQKTQAHWPQFRERHAAKIADKIPLPDA
jgi:hypothetical protein